MPVISPDRRSALKARHRAAILGAARALVEDRGRPDFGVDELAARADVARRTVFNHFASLDDVLLTVCSDVLAVLVENFLSSVARAPLGDGSRASMLDELETAMRMSDLTTPIAAIVRIVGVPAAQDRRGNDLAEAAFSRVSARLMVEVQRRHTGADQLDVELLVGSLMNGVATLARHWVGRTGAREDEESRAEWDRLLTRLLDTLRSGYMPE